MSTTPPTSAQETSPLLSEIFPPKVAITLNRVADAQSIPREAMLTHMLLLGCSFSPTAYTSGIGSHVEPHVLHLKNLGFSDINKTGATNYNDHVFQKVRSALVAFANDSSLCIEHGIHVSDNLIAESDTTCTQAAQSA